MSTNELVSKFLVVTEIGFQRDMVGTPHSTLEAAKEVFEKTEAPKGGLVKLIERYNLSGKNINDTVYVRHSR